MTAQHKPWRYTMREAAPPDRADWYAAMMTCPACYAGHVAAGKKLRSNYCAAHRERLELIERAENAAAIAKSRAAPLPKPPPLPPRGTLR